MHMAAVRRASVLVIALMASAQAAFGQTVSYLNYNPQVLSTGTTAPVLVEAEISGTLSSASIEFSPAGATVTTIALKDDGTGGDRVAGDRIYSCQLPATPILSARTADDVYRVFIGYLDLFNGSTRALRANLFLDIYDPEIGAYGVRRLTQFVQTTNRLVNIHDAGFFASRSPSRVTLEFYRNFADEFDMVNLITAPQQFANRNHLVLKNTVRGIGLNQIDLSEQYGSRRLLGINNFPLPGYFDGAETAYVHETGHQWINYINAQPVADGRPHWPYSSMANGVMGFSIGGPGGEGGNFNCDVVEDARGIVLSTRIGAPVFSNIDLYLMGLVNARDAGYGIVFTDQTAAARLNCNGQVFTGAVQRMAGTDLQGALGERIPAAGQAQTTFRMATILVTRDGLASPEMMSLYSWLSERAELRARIPTHSGFAKESGAPFFVATGGRASLETDIDTGDGDFAVTPTVATQSVTRGGRATYQIEVKTRRRRVDQAVQLSCGALPANAICSFDQSSVTPGAGSQTVTLTIATATPAPVAAGTYVVIVRGTTGNTSHSTAVTLQIQ